MDFFHHGSPPLFLSHLACAYCMYYALGVFAAVYEYTCPFTPLSTISISPPLPLLPYRLSFFSVCSPPSPILADRKTNSFFKSRVVSWFCLFSQLTAWTHTHTHAGSTKNMLTPVQHHILRGEYSWHKYKSTRAVLCGMTQVSLRWTSLLVKARQPETYTHKHLFIYTSLLILLPDRTRW